MSFKAHTGSVVRQIVHEVHAGDVLTQTASVVQVQDVVVVSLVLLGISFGKLALANSGNTRDEHLAMIVKQTMQRGQFCLPSAEVATGRRDAVVQDEVGRRGR